MYSSYLYVNLYIYEYVCMACVFREWKYFNYEPRVFRFGNETGSGLDKGGSRDISLPQFSSAAVPKVTSVVLFLLFWSA